MLGHRPAPAPLHSARHHVLARAGQRWGWRGEKGGFGVCFDSASYAPHRTLPHYIQLQRRQVEVEDQAQLEAIMGRRLPLLAFPSFANEDDDDASESQQQQSCVLEFYIRPYRAPSELQLYLELKHGSTNVSGTDGRRPVCLVVMLPAFPRTLADLRYTRFWLRRLARLHFAVIYFSLTKRSVPFVLNPQLLEALFPNRRMCFNTNNLRCSVHSQPALTLVTRQFRVELVLNIGTGTETTGVIETEALLDWLLLRLYPVPKEVFMFLKSVRNADFLQLLVEVRIDQSIFQTKNNK